MQQNFSICNNSLLSDITAQDIAQSLQLPQNYRLNLEVGYFDDITTIIIEDDCGIFVGCISLRDFDDIDKDQTLRISGYNVCLCFRQVIEKHQQLRELAERFKAVI